MRGGEPKCWKDTQEPMVLRMDRRYAGAVKIDGPKSLQKEYRNYLLSLAEEVV